VCSFYTYTEFRYTERDYAECRFVECYYAVCRSAYLIFIFSKNLKKKFLFKIFSRFKFNFYVGELVDVTTLLNQSLQHCQSIFPAKKIRDFPAKNMVIFPAKNCNFSRQKIYGFSRQKN